MKRNITVELDADLLRELRVLTGEIRALLAALETLTDRD